MTRTRLEVPRGITWQILAFAVGLVIVSHQPYVAGMKITVNKRECVEEEVHHDGELVSGSFVVSNYEGLWGRSNPIGMDLSVYSPAGQLVHSVRGQVEDDFNFTASKKGFYKFCFEHKAHYPEAVVFSLYTGRHFDENDAVVKDEHMKPVIEAIESLSDTLADVESEREYLEARGDRHYETLHNTQQRMVGYAMLEAFALLGSSVAQAYLLKRLFEKKNRDRV